MLPTAEVEVLSPPDHLVAPAAGALGWDGVVLPPMTLLGRHVAVVAELVPDVHAQRAETGWAPVTDRTEVAIWDWPELAHRAPAPAVALRGVLAPARHWRTGITGAVGFSGLCPAATLLPPEVARDGACRSYAERYGPALVAASECGTDVDVVQEGRSHSAARSPAMSRWVHEVVYEQLLAHT